MARYAATIYQGQADLASRTGALRAQNLGQTAAAGTFQQPAYVEHLIASAWLYLPLIQK